MIYLLLKVENFSLAWENLKVNVIEKQSNFWTTKTTKKAIIHDSINKYLLTIFNNILIAVNSFRVFK